MSTLATIAIGLAALLAMTLLLVFWAKREKVRRATVIDLLRQHGPLSGLEMVERSGGILKRGAVYVTLAALEGEGLVAKFDDGRCYVLLRRAEP